jgi:hypothetical protein
MIRQYRVVGADGCYVEEAEKVLFCAANSSVKMALT